MSGIPKPVPRSRVLLGVLAVTWLVTLTVIAHREGWFQATQRPSPASTSAPASASPLETPSSLPPPQGVSPPRAGEFLFRKRLYLTWSRDLVHWAPPQVAVEGCDTPQLAWVEGLLQVYYNTSRGFARVEVSGNATEGFKAGPQQPLAISATRWGGATDPSVLRLRSGRYRMYYTLPHFNAAVDPAEVPCEVRSAISSNGLTWMEEGGARFTGQGIVDPEVVKTTDGRLRLYYTGYVGTQVRSAVSTDGLRFEAEPRVRVWGGVSSTLQTSDGRYTMLYQVRTGRRDGAEPPARLLLARSSDGLTFTPDPQFVPPPAPNPQEGEECGSLAQTPDGTWLLVFVSPPPP